MAAAEQPAGQLVADCWPSTASEPGLLNSRRRHSAASTIRAAVETEFLSGAVRNIADYNQAFPGMAAPGRVGLTDDIRPVVTSLVRPDDRWIDDQRIEVSSGHTI